MPKKTKRKKADVKMYSRLDEKFKENFDEDEHRSATEKISKKNVADANLEYILLFGANKNLFRSVPNMISGLKPGATRLYYSWWEKSGRPQNTKSETLKKLKFFKVEQLSSETVKYHPHGTSALQGLIGTAGQYWSNNVMMIVPQGAFGNLRGQEPASGRYIEAKLSEYIIDCFFDDFDKYSVPMRPAYTGDGEEPTVLPSKYPHILFNPQFSGLGYGLASNIPSFNVTEVLDATIKLIKDPEAKILLYPDSPTGADIIDDGQFKKINKTGNGNFVMKATSTIDYINNTITITSLPINSSSADVISKVIDFRTKGNKEFQHIIKIDDNTQEGFVEIIFYLDNKENTKPNKVLKELYKKQTGLKTTFPVGIAVIDDFKVYEYGIKDLLLAWIDYRIDAVRSMTLNAYQQTLAKHHLNEVLIMVFAKENIEDVIKISKSSKTKKEMEEKLIKKFKITSAQAKTISEMHVYQFNKDQHTKYIEARKDLEKEIKMLKDRLETPGSIEKFIIKQLEEGKKKYGHPRKSNIIKEKVVDIKNSDHIVGISESGYVKKIPESFESIGTIGKGNSPSIVLEANNKELVLIIDSTGMVYNVKISDIPDMSYDDIGIPLSKLFNINGIVRSVITLPTKEVLNDNTDDKYIVFVTKQGYTKRTKISEFKDIRKEKCGIKLNDGDELITSFFNLNTNMKDIILYTNFGNGIRIRLHDIRMISSKSIGNKITKLGKGEYIVGANRVKLNSKYFLFITSSGGVKLVESKYLKTMEKGDPMIILTPLVENENLIAVCSVNKSDIVNIYQKTGGFTSINISDLELSSRNAKCKNMFKGIKRNPIIGYKILEA